MNKLNNLLLGICCLFTSHVMAQVSFGESQKINDRWRFTLNEQPEGQLQTLNDSRWQVVNLPHDWSVKGQLSPTLASCTGFLPGGIGWYRKTLNVPADKDGKKVYLYFEGVYNRSEVFVNGHSVGKRPNGYLSFLVDATPYIQIGKENKLAVKVDHSQSADSRWYTGSGIYRNVWVVYANPIHMEQWGVYAHSKQVTAKNALLEVAVSVENGTAEPAKLTVVNELLSPEGKVVAKASKQLMLAPNAKQTLAAELKVDKPQLWDLNQPTLYQLKTTILKDAKLIDQTTTTTGFRTFTFDANKGFALNQQSMKVKGVCIHHDAGVLGAAVPKEVWKRRIMTLKSIGCNAIRTSHNPQSPDLYDLCDELGVLVLNEAYDEWEFPKRKWLEGWNVGTPGFQGTFDIFANWSEEDLADLVRRDRNHLSVFAWSIGNEVDYPNDPYSHPILEGSSDSGFSQPIFGGYKKEAPDAMRLGAIAKRLVAVVKKHDSSRPVTAGLAGVAMSNETEYPGALDITGYNYTESKYAADHQTYPKRILFGSENRHELAAWKAARDNEYVFGQFLWTGIDYLGESGKWPSRGFYSGLLDLGGFVKPRGYFRASLWAETPMAYLGTYPTPGKGNSNPTKDAWSAWSAGNSAAAVERTPSMDAWPIWNYEPEQSIRVVCYTNAAQAQLILNGKTIGQPQLKNDESGIIHWDIPYQPGILSVIAMDKEGKELVRNAIQSSKQPYALQLVAGETSISKEGGVAQLVIQVVDENGIPVMLSDNKITCQIKGAATLLGLEASNNEDMGDYTDNVQNAHHGRILAYIQAKGKGDSVTVRFSSPWLKSVETVIALN